MHGSLRASLGVLALLLAATGGAATLVGDNLTFGRYYPDTGTFYGAPPLSATVLVANDASDLANWSELGGWGPVSGIHYIQFNPQASTIDVTLVSPGEYVRLLGDFDGYIISGFSHDILSATASYTGLEVTHLAREIRLNFLGVIQPGNFSIAVNTSEVPLPGTVGLLGLALGGIVALRGIGVRRG